MPWLTLKSVLRHGLLPAAAGVGCGWLSAGPQPEGSSPAPASFSKRPIVSAPTPAPEAQSLPDSSIASKETDSKIIGKYLALLAKNRRVEDLLVEVQKLPPGKERDQGIQLLMKEWFPLDRAAAVAWMESLPGHADKEYASAGMVESWCKEDSHAVSAWVAALPNGPLKQTTGRTLSDSLVIHDPASSLSWALASRAPGENLDDNIRHRIAGLAYHDYETVFKLIEEADLSASEQQSMEKKARAAWNFQCVRGGKWQELLPVEGTAP